MSTVKVKDPKRAEWGYYDIGKEEIKGFWEIKITSTLNVNKIHVTDSRKSTKWSNRSTCLEGVPGTASAVYPILLILHN